MQERPSIVTECFEAIMTLMAEKKLRVPLPFRTFKASQIEDAFRYLQSGQNAGKVVVEMGADEPIEVSVQRRGTIRVWASSCINFAYRLS